MAIQEVKVKITTERIVKIGVKADGMIAAQTEVAAMLTADRLKGIRLIPIEEKTVCEILGTDFVV